MILALPLAVTNYLALSNRLDTLTNVDAKADRLLMLSLSHIMSSRVNLMRYENDLLPSASEALNDVRQAEQFLEEARILISAPEQETATAQILAGLVSYNTVINEVQNARMQNKSENLANLLFNAYRIQFDLDQQIRAVVSASETSVAAANEAALTDARQRLNLLIIGYVVLLVFAILTAMVVQQSITRPITELYRGAEKFRVEKIATPIPSEGSDELATLAQTFNQISAELTQTFVELEQRVADRTKALATTTEVSHRLSTILKSDELVREVVNQVQSAFGYYHAHIYLLEDDDLVMAGGTGEAGAEMLAEGHRVPKGRGLVGRAAETNETVLVPDTSQEDGWLPNPLLPDTMSEVAIPISVGDQVLGVLDVQHNVVAGLDREDVDSLASIAYQVAVALENVASAETVAKRARELETVAAISTTTAKLQNADEMLATVVHLTQHQFGLYHAHVFVLDEKEAQLKVVACGWQEGDENEGTTESIAIPVGQEQSLVARAARTKQAVIINDVQNEPGWLPNPQLPDTRAEMAVPLVVGDQVLGVLDVQSERLNAFSQEDANIQMTLASQVATALQNARSFTQAQQQAERETRLNTITQKIQGTATVEEAMQIAARELGHALGRHQTLVALDPAALGSETKEQ
jgi:putative methionine-R-sulfoxide reductase with GAF domain